MPEPRNYDREPLTPRDLQEQEARNPRDPQGGVGSQLNPTRDHVQGEPEGTTPDANEHTPSPSQAPTDPARP